MLIFENNGSKDAEYSDEAEDDKKSGNFNSQLTKIKSVQLSPQLSLWNAPKMFCPQNFG